jgi:PPOX class probable F420-dependent enzyme
MGHRAPSARVPDLRTGLIAAIAAAMAFVCAAPGAHSEISPRDLAALSRSQLIFIATVRKDGNQSKAAPVWFTLGADGKSILIQTGSTTWKARRIRRGSPVLVWIGDANGPAFIGKAEISADAAIVQRILDTFAQKYWLNRMFGVGPSRGELRAGRQVAIVITPMRDLPAGFRSAPGSKPPPMLSPPIQAPAPPGKGS